MHTMTLRTQRAIATLVLFASFLFGCGSQPAPTVPAAADAGAALTAPVTVPGAATPSAVDGGALAPPAPTFDAGSVGPLPPSPTTPAVDDAFFTTRLQQAGAPGAAMAIVKSGTVAWTKGYGYADVAAAKPATADTLFMVASISKTVVATALLQLMEHSPGGLALLDADVSASLGFLLRNPRYPNVPITYRMLLTHTSSLIDGPYFQDFEWTLGDSPIPLGSFVAAYVQDPRNWSDAIPGTDYSYSNGASTLTGYIVERASGMNLQQYSQSFIFTPLGMQESSWFLNGLDPSHIAMPYVLDVSGYRPTGQYGFADYPDGQLRTSAAQLARFLLVLAGDGSLGGARVLSGATTAEMRRHQFGPNDEYQGLVLFAATSNGRTHYGHDGATLGGSNDMWFDPATGAGYVLLTNSNVYLDGTQTQLDAMAQMNNELARLAATIP